MAALMCRSAGSPLFLLLRPESLSWACRRGARALRRRPVRVLPPLADHKQPQGVSREAAAAMPRAHALPARKAGAQSTKRAGPKEEEPPPEPKDPPLFRYERAYKGDKRLSKVVTVAKSRPFREKHGKILLEGHRLIADALAAGAVPQTLFFSMMEQLRKLPQEKLKRATLVKVKFEEIKDWSDVVTPQGIIGIFSRPDHSKLVYKEVEPPHRLPLSLICDNIRDPGNLGTILRSASGAGCSRVLLIKGCVDAWEPKVLRAGMGAHFQIPVISNLEWESLPNYLLSESCIHVADSSRPAPEPEDEPVLHGKACDHGWVSRPYNMKAQLTRLGSGADPESEEEEDAEDADGLEVQHYYEPWMDSPVAVVIGGETHGVSKEARQLAHSTGGKQLIIPIVPSVNSLNSAMAASILIFEAKRQLMLTDQPVALKVNQASKFQLDL